MFDELFMRVIDMSKTASIVILVVLIARLLLKKAPKVISYALWAIVLFRLLCPVSIEAPVSILPEMDPVSFDYSLADEPISATGDGIAAYQAVGDALNGGLGVQHIPTTEPNESGNIRYVASDWWDVWILFGQYVWLGGILVMAIYGIVTWLRLRRRLLTASPLRENIYLADEITSPFVMGLIRPKIYLPSDLREREQSYIILHEQHHIRRLDHMVKALAFAALCIHWFNPLVWVAFILSGKDMEMSCDEAVVGQLGTEIRADYSASLLSLATGKRIIAGMPLAFGEGNTKGRIKNLANWKKPAFWVVLAAVIACIVLAVCLLTNPETKQDLSFLNYENLVSVAAQSDTHPASKSDDQNRYTIDGPKLAQFLDTASWTAQNGITRSVQRDTDQNSKSSIQITLDGTYLKVFDTDTANIYDETTGKDRYYRMADGDYEKLFAMLSLDNNDTAYNAVAGKTYVYEGEGIMGSFTITLYDDGTFTYYEGMASSYIGIGSWEQNGDSITLTDDGHGGYGLVNHFKLDGDDLVFVEQDSDNFVYVKVKSEEKFHCTGEAFKQNDGADGAVQIMPSLKLSLNDVIMLSQKGYDLTWADFEQFKYIETGSGLYIRVYEINELYELWIGGSSPDTVPMYIYLRLADDLDTRIDIRDGGVTEFISSHSTVSQENNLDTAISKAILEHYASDDSDGLFHVESHVLLANEAISATPLLGQNNHTEETAVYLLVFHEKYSTYGGALESVGGSYVPTAITFTVSESGEYTLKEYWEPRDGNDYVKDIRAKFPGASADDALNDQAYIEDLQVQNLSKAQAYLNSTGGLDVRIADLLDIIQSSPATASNPGDYMEAHEAEYQELLGYGKYTLRYCFTEFLAGGQTDLRGHIMAHACEEISNARGEALLIDAPAPVTGQDWFDAFQGNAVRLSEQFSEEDLEKYYPASWLLLQMMNE